MLIEIFADIWCPFTHVGLRAVAEHRHRAGRDDVQLLVRAWPLELVNGAPMDPAKARHHADDLRAQAAPEMFADLDEAHFPSSTIDALALVHRAYRTDAALGERASFVLRDALFEQGRDVSDPAVLASVAEDLGISPADADDRAAIVADWHEGQARGVQGSPHFFCGDDSMFCPSLDIRRTADGDLVVVPDRTKLGDFLDRCFAAPD
jgi:predicted DsbA family dithiol-disulfide isomerase